jgi:hypothetical protein
MGGVADVPPECLVDGLMAEAYTQERYSTVECTHRVLTDTGLPRASGARGEHDRFGMERSDIGKAHRVIAYDLDLASKRTNELVKVI